MAKVWQTCFPRVKRDAQVFDIYDCFGALSRAIGRIVPVERHRSYPQSVNNHWLRTGMLAIWGHITDCCRSIKQHSDPRALDCGKDRTTRLGCSIHPGKCQTDSVKTGLRGQ